MTTNEFVLLQMMFDKLKEIKEMGRILHEPTRKAILAGHENVVSLEELTVEQLLANVSDYLKNAKPSPASRQASPLITVSELAQIINKGATK